MITVIVLHFSATVGHFGTFLDVDCFIDLGPSAIIVLAVLAVSMNIAITIFNLMTWPATFNAVLAQASGNLFSISRRNHLLDLDPGIDDGVY